MHSLEFSYCGSGPVKINITSTTEVLPCGVPHEQASPAPNAGNFRFKRNAMIRGLRYSLPKMPMPNHRSQQRAYTSYATHSELLKKQQTVLNLQHLKNDAQRQRISCFKNGLYSTVAEHSESETLQDMSPVRSFPVIFSDGSLLGGNRGRRSNGP